MSFTSAIDRPTELLSRQKIDGGMWSNNQTQGVNYDPLSQFSNPLPGNMSTKQDTIGDNGNFNTGVQISNYSSINLHWYQRFTARFPVEASHDETLVFLERSCADGTQGFRSRYEMAGLYELNRFLASVEGIERYGEDMTSQRIMDDFGLAGSYNAEVKGDINGSYVATVVVGQRARVGAFTKAYHSDDDKLSDRILEHVWLIPIKFLKPKIKDSFSEKPLNEDEERKRRYWQMVAYKGRGKAPSASWYHASKEGTGTPIHLGYISDFEPSNSYEIRETARARNAMNGLGNIYERVYLKECVGMRTVDLILGLQ